MKNEICPPESELSAFVRCQVSEDQAEWISDHISNCPQCEETVVGLEKGADTVFERLNYFPAAFPFQHEPELERMAQAAKHRATVPAENESKEQLPVGMPDYLRDYQIIKKIGEGGMGAVYKAVHQRLKKTVALKILATNRIGDQPAMARFEREMSVIGQLNHPHIVQALDAGEHDGQHYLVMEYVDGRDLSDIVKRCSPLSISNACQLILQAAIGLQCAHEHGFVHRDIKPSNLMLAITSQRAAQSPAVVKILDLGLARALDQPVGTAAGTVDLTTTGQVMGTLDYMAPEQGGDAHQVDIRADIYSLGATLYKLLTGDSPYAEHAQKPPLQRLMAIAQHEPPAIQSKRREIPDKLAAIVHRMMAKKPENRFSTPADVAAALEPFCAGADLAALLAPQDATQKLELRPQSSRTEVQSSSAGGSYRRWSTALAGFGGFLVFAAILLITTRHGTVEVSSPEGKLPDDVKVVVSRGGEEVEILQADNQWSAKIVNGEYQVQLRGGEDRFVIKDSKLTISRLGRVAVTVDARQPDSKTGKNIAATIPVDGAQTKLPAGQPEAESRAAPDWSLVAPIPAEVIPDQEKPFVVISKAAQVVGEYKFITEVLPILKSNEILEIRGNGPFKVPQVVRDKEALHIRGGKGYRPQFIADFATPDNRQNEWLRLNEVALSVKGCDFVGSPAEHFCLFAGSGEWLFQDCRLIGRTTHTGGLFGFFGPKLVIRDSLLTCHSAYFSTNIGPKVQIELCNNIVFNSGTIFSTQLGAGSSFSLKSNLFYRTQLFSFYALSGDDPLYVVAEDNLFITPHAAICQTKPELPVRKLLNWKGARNRVIQSKSGALFDTETVKNTIDPLPKTVEDWNKYWKNDADLRQSSGVVFEWDFLALKDWTAGAERFQNEIAVARRTFPSLPQVGPDMELVGARPMHDQTRQKNGEQPNGDRSPALEGGPFVIIRNDKPVAGFVSLSSALEKTRTGDIVEVRSDGALRTGRLAPPKDQQLTLRAGEGYSPLFAELWLMGGDWTLEGLQFRPETLTDTLACTARRVVNCTIGTGGANTDFYLHAPEGLENSIEVLNCYLAQGLVFNGPGLNVSNSVVRSISLQRETSFTANKSCFWKQSTPICNSIACIGQSGSGKVDMHLTNCLIDTDYILAISDTKWTGERNLFRIHGSNWSSLPITGQPARAYRSLTEWRDLWKSDVDSQFDESALLRPELWRQQ